MRRKLLTAFVVVIGVVYCGYLAYLAIDYLYYLRHGHYLADTAYTIRGTMPTLKMRSVATYHNAAYTGPTSTLSTAPFNLQHESASYSPFGASYSGSAASSPSTFGASPLSGASFSAASYRHTVPSFSAASYSPISTSLWIVPTTSRVQAHNLTAANTLEAEATVINTTSAAHTSGILGSPIDNPEPFPDDEEETPIGALPILFFLLLSMGYIHTQKRRSVHS